MIQEMKETYQGTCAPGHDAQGLASIPSTQD